MSSVLIGAHHNHRGRAKRLDTSRRAPANEAFRGFGRDRHGMAAGRAWSGAAGLLARLGMARLGKAGRTRADLLHKDRPFSFASADEGLNVDLCRIRRRRCADRHHQRHRAVNAARRSFLRELSTPASPRSITELAMHIVSTG